MYRQVEPSPLRHAITEYLNDPDSVALSQASVIWQRVLSARTKPLAAAGFARYKEYKERLSVALEQDEEDHLDRLEDEASHNVGQFLQLEEEDRLFPPEVEAWHDWVQFCRDREEWGVSDSE